MSEDLDLKNRVKKINGKTTSFIEHEIISLEHPVLDGIFHGGFPKGSIIQLAAQSGVGKTTLVLQISKILCSKGFNVAYFDVENGLNKNLLHTTGVLPFVDNYDTEVGGLFLVVNENDCNKVNTKLLEYYENNLADVFIIDSLGALDNGYYNLKNKGDVDNPKIGGNSQAIAKIMSTINGIRQSREKSIILINHLAQVIGSYIPQEKPKGGEMVKYIPDITLYLKANLGASGALKNNKGQKVGQRVSVIAEKSRWGDGKESIPFYIFFGIGIALIPTMAELFKEKEIKTKDGVNTILTITPGSAKNHLYLPSGDYEFTGSDFIKNIAQVISDHYKECLSLLSSSDFMVKVEKEEWEKKELELSQNSVTEDLKKNLPPTLQDLEVVDVTVPKIYFVKGVDNDGQPYSISYNYKDKILVLEYDSQEQMKPRPSINIYNDFKKKLDEYLA